MAPLFGQLLLHFLDFWKSRNIIYKDLEKKKKKKKLDTNSQDDTITKF